ncbi:hypothetical protein DFJ77DRAFT_512037 [Powellomyces hirtus]|nr:hypothetical protein DFJ77DRAFT_512037 [Powellomyces hirtus]
MTLHRALAYRIKTAVRFSIATRFSTEAQMEQTYNNQQQQQQTDRGLFSDMAQKLNPSNSTPGQSSEHDNDKNLKIGVGSVLGAVAVAGVGYLAYDQWLKHQGSSHSDHTVNEFKKLAGKHDSDKKDGDKKDKKDKKEKKHKDGKKDKKDKKHKKGSGSDSSSSSDSD